MKTITISGVLLSAAVAGIAGIYFLQNAYADTSIHITTQGGGNNSVHVNSNQSVSSTTDNTSSVSNHIIINGKEYVNDTNSSNGTYNSRIQVNLHNNSGSINYNVNGNDKTIDITPDSNSSVVVPDTGASVHDQPAENKPSVTPVPKAAAQEKHENRSLLQNIFVSLEDLLGKLFSGLKL